MTTAPAPSPSPDPDDRERLLAAWEGSPFGVVLLDAEGRVTHRNEAMRSITGYDASELAQLPVASYTHPDDAGEMVSSFRSLRRGETDSYRIETRLIAKGGGTVWVDCYVATMPGSPDAPWTALGMVRDITPRKLAELALRDQNARLSRVVETQAEITAAGLGLEAVAQLIAERAQELTGADGVTVTILDGENLATRVAAGTPDGKASVSVPLLHGGRTIGRLELAKETGATDDDRRTLELLAVLLSSAVSEAAEREARREQMEALARFETIFEHAPIGIGLLSPDGTLRIANTALREITGRNAEELATKSVLAYTAPEDVEQVTRLFRGMLEGKYESYRQELRVIAENGDVVWIDNATAILPDVDGEPQGAVTMSQNISLRRAAEEQLRQSQKLDAIGQLTAGIAHDFNNLLLGMLGFTELARAEVDSGSQAAEYLSHIESSAQRAAKLTGQLLAFGRRQALHPEALELNDLVSDTVGMLRSTLGERIGIVTVLEPALDAVQADVHQMQQVLLNLALNARDAMPNGGTLTIRTHNANVGAGEPRSRDLDAGRYVVLTVEDDGFGMTHEVTERIFDPFFTTKGVGKGTGLGLSSALGIVKQSGGHIEVASEPGRGSAFHSYLPALPTAVPAEVLSEASPDVAQRILVVEDEDIVRSLIARSLEGLGYAVETAEDPSLALPTLRERGDEFALVISDMVMPQMTGAEFAREVAAWKPALPFVFMSGYTQDLAAQPTGVAGGSFLQKPFSLEALATTVRDALEHSA